MSLNKKIAHGAFWALLEKLGQQGLSFVVFLILARILGPAEFGLVNVCYIYITLSYFIITGAMEGIVALQIRDDVRLSTMLWAGMGLGAILSLISFTTAGPFAAAMKHKEIEDLLHWIAVVPLLIAAQSVPYALVMKSMDFRVYTIRTIIANVAGGVTGVTMALKGFGAYSLIAQQIVMYLVTNLVIWPSCGWWPRLAFDAKALPEIMAPGAKMSSSYLIDFFDQQTPRLIVGSFVGIAAVGYYSLVTRIRQALYDVLIHPLAVVLYPAFSSIRDDDDAQRIVLGQVLTTVSLFIFPAILGAIAMADVYVPVLFGDAWKPAIPVLQLLLLTGGTMPFVVILRDVMRAHNKSGPFLKIQIVVVVCNLVQAFVLASRGLVIMSLGWVIVSLLSLPAYIYALGRGTNIKLWKEFLRLLVPLGGAAIMACAIYGLNHAGAHLGNAFLLMALDIVMGIVVYAAFVFIFMRQELRLLRGMIGGMRRKKLA